MGGENYQPSRVEVRSIFPLESGIAITIHKAQGRTIQKVILCLSNRKSANMNPKYAALHVALSRVRWKEDRMGGHIKGVGFLGRTFSPKSQEIFRIYLVLKWYPLVASESRQ